MQKKKYILTFLFPKIWLFLEIIQDFWFFFFFFNFQKSLFQIVSIVFKVTKKSFYHNHITDIMMQPWKIIENDQNFFEFFDFWQNFRFFWSNIFFTDFTPQDLPLCKTSAFYFETLIFLSIFISFDQKWQIFTNCQFLVTPPYFGPHVLPPPPPHLWSGPASKKFHLVHKGEFWICHKFQVDSQ